jgi:hypothetical protein
VSRSGWFRRPQSMLVTGGKRIGRGTVLTGGGAALVMAAGVTFVAFGSPGSHAAPVTGARPAAATAPLQPAVALQVMSVTPAAGAHNVNGGAPIRVQFSSPLAANTPMPSLSPKIAGRWQVQGDTAVFTPATGWYQDTRVTLKIPGGSSGMVSVDGASAGSGGLLGSGVTESFTTGSFSTCSPSWVICRSPGPRPPGRPSARATRTPSSRPRTGRPRASSPGRVAIRRT